MGIAVKRVNLRLEGVAGRILRHLAHLAYRMRHKAATVALIALTAPLAYKAVFGSNGALTYRGAQVQSKQLDSEIQQLQSQNDKLKLNINALRTDRNAIEREAREQLHYVRPTDTVIAVPPSALPPPSPPPLAAQRR